MSQSKAGSKADTLVKVILIFFISLLSFSVGTFVGKQVSDSDHRRLALEGDAHREVASNGHDEHGMVGEDAQGITDEEVARLTEEFVNKEKAASTREIASTEGERHAPVPPAEHAPAAEKGGSGFSGYKQVARHGEKAPAHADAHTAPAHGDAPSAAAKTAAKVASMADATHDIANKVAHDQAPTDGKPETRKPQSVLPSVASGAIGKFTVQVASYADENEARNHAADLKHKGWQAFYLSANVSGRTWYRVVVGLFDDSKSARAFKDKLMNEAKVGSAIVQKIIK